MGKSVLWITKLVNLRLRKQDMNFLDGNELKLYN